MRGCITKRGKSWLIKYDVDRDPATGKRRQRYAWIKTSRDDAERELRRLLKAVDDNDHVDPSKLTVGQWLSQWLAEVAPLNASGKTLERYGELVNHHAIPGIGALRLQKLTAAQVQSYYGKALASGRLDGKGGLSAQTVNHIDRVLNVALKSARKLGLISKNPIEDVERPKVDEKEVEALDDAAVKRLLDAARTTRIYVPVLVALTTGLRRGELLALRWRDVALDGTIKGDVPRGGGVLSVAQAVQQIKTGITFKTPKTRRSRRTIALPAVTVEALRQHRTAQAQERLRLGLGRDDSALVFAQADASPVNPRAFSKEYARVAKRAKVPTSVHALRHTHMSQLLRSGVHVKVASERAGHASVAITMDRYSHVMPGMQEDAAAKVDAAMRAALGE